jgi:hypothetical protein
VAKETTYRMPSKEAVKEIMQYHFNRLGLPLSELDSETDKCYDAMKKYWHIGNDWCMDILTWSENIIPVKELKEELNP